MDGWMDVKRVIQCFESCHTSFAQHYSDQVPTGELLWLLDQPEESERAPVLGCDQGRFPPGELLPVGK